MKMIKTSAFDLFRMLNNVAIINGKHLEKKGKNLYLNPICGNLSEISLILFINKIK